MMIYIILLVDLVLSVFAKRTQYSEGVITFPLTEIKTLDPKFSIKRYSKSLFKGPYRVYRTMAIYLGEPSQKIHAVLDVRSSRLLVQSDRTTMVYNKLPDPWNLFKANKSSTLSESESEFSFVYDQMGHVSGYLTEETLTFNGVKVPQFPMYLADTSEFEQSILGLSLPCKFCLHESLLGKLANDGIISYASYALWLNHGEYGDVADIAFGGIDRSLIASENIFRFPLVRQPSWRDEVHPTIVLDNIYYFNPDGVARLMFQMSHSVTIDPGYTLSKLPFDVLAEVFGRIGGTTMDGVVWVVSCDILQRIGGLGLEFSGVVIWVPFKDIAIVFDKEHNTCIPGFIADDHALLGNNILKHLYVVYDPMKYELGLGLAAKGRQKKQDLRGFSTGIDGIMAPDYSSIKPKSRFKSRNVPFKTIGCNESNTLTVSIDIVSRSEPTRRHTWLPVYAW